MGLELGNVCFRPSAHFTFRHISPHGKSEHILAELSSTIHLLCVQHKTRAQAVILKSETYNLIPAQRTQRLTRT